MVAGTLDEAVEAAESLMAQTSEREQLYNSGRIVSAWTKAARGQSDEALAESEQALGRAREIGDPQAVAPALDTRAFALFLAGREADASVLAEEFLAHTEMLVIAGYAGDVPLLLAELGRGDDFVTAVGHVHWVGLWHDAGVATARGEFARAAEIYEGMGARFLEAWARLLAAENGDRVQLDAALAFFARERALPFVRRCEALLSASA
jgi:tetratricopeptide (TPR) repeat protein